MSAPPEPEGQSPAERGPIERGPIERGPVERPQLSSTRRRSGARPPRVPGFEPRELLGRGGMGAVWRARELETGREVALKLLVTRVDDPVWQERLRREAQLTARLSHPSIVRVLSQGELEGRPWIAYELVEGARTFGAALPELPRRARVELVRDAARALGHAHARGVVHRDVKGDNLLLDARGHLRVADFGLAQAADLERLTRTGAMVGTLGHMAPEQLRGDPSGPPADVWALGVVLFQALTGSAPFEGATPAETVARIEVGAPPAPRKLDRTVPPDLEQVCLQALARDPAARYPHGDALADELDRWLLGERVAAGGAWRARLRPRGAALILLALALLAPLPLLLLPPHVDPHRIERETRAICDDALSALGCDGALQLEAERLAQLRARWGDVQAEVARGRLAADSGQRLAQARLLAGQGLLAAIAGADGAARAALAELQAEPLADPGPRLALEGLLSLADRPARAAKLLAGARAQGVSCLEVRLAEGLALHRAGLLSPARADEALRDLARSGPDLGAAVSAELELGALVTTGRLEQAFGRLRDLPGVDPQLAWLIALARAREAIEAGQPADALAALRASARPVGPLQPVVLAGQERVVQEVRSRTDRLLLELHDHPLEGDRFGLLLQLLGALRLADPDLELVAARDQAALVSRGVAYVEGRRLTGEQLRELADLFPDQAPVQEAVAIHAGRIGRRDKVPLLPVVRRAYELAGDPERREALGVNLARTLLQLDQLEECLARCEEMSREPWSAEARATVLALRAEAWGRKEVWDAALGDLQRAEAAFPGIPAREPLLWARVLRGGGQLERAWTMALTGLQGEPATGEVDSSGRDEAIMLVWDLGQRLDAPDRLAATLDRFLVGHEGWGGWWVRLARVRLACGEPAAASLALRRGAAAAERRRDPRLLELAPLWRELADRVEARDPTSLPVVQEQVEVLERLRGTSAQP